jgi:hypothetical protein
MNKPVRWIEFWLNMAIRAYSPNLSPRIDSDRINMGVKNWDVDRNVTFRIQDVIKLANETFAPMSRRLETKM